MTDNRDRCPLCEAPNGCALADNHKADRCWCQSVDFNPELLSQISPADKNRRCICQACAEKAHRLATAIR